MGDISGYLIVGAVAAVVTWALTPFVTRFATRIGWMVEPDPRRVHTVATPDVGGIAMMGGVIAAVFVAWQMDRFDSLFRNNSETWGLLLAALCIFGVGLIDDVRDISAPAKVAGTVLAGMLLVWTGVTMFYFRVPFLDVFVLSNDWVPLVTVLWLLGMTNAINLIDGLDGLAAGIVAIASGSFFVYSAHLADIGKLPEPNLGPLVAVITVGICLGFLPHNFNPAKIFMGDSGSFLLGLLMAVSTSVVGGRTDPTTQNYSGQSYFFYAPLVIPLVILGVPIFDVIFAIIRRASKRQSFAAADKGHLHHRLIQLGHGQRRSVLILWCWTALLSGLVLYFVFAEVGKRLVVFALAAVGLILYTILHPEVRRRRA